MEIRKIAVLGAGLMGSGIAQVCAQAGFEVAMVDVEEKLVETGFQSIEKSLRRFVKSGKLEEGEVERIVERIKGTTDLKKAVGDADLVVEAVPEDMGLKKKLFKELDEICPSHTLLASNTSGLMITDIASATNRPEKVVGMHWFNPPPMMKLIEMVRGALTSDETYETIWDLSIRLGKEPVPANDGPGFFTTRYISSYLAEAIRLFEMGVAGIEEMDRMVKLGFGWPMGPIELADFVGLDTNLHILEYMHEETGDPRYAPPLTLKKLVRSGYLGKKPGSKGGFYEYFGISR